MSLAPNLHWFPCVGVGCELGKEELQKRGLFLVNNFSFGLLFTQSYHVDLEDLKYCTI